MVFIVDDNDVNLITAASILEEDYRVLTMPSAGKMFLLLEKKLPDLILLDVEMPEMNGLEAIAKLKENPAWRDIPVLFLTAWADDKLRSQAAESGVLDIILKPVIPENLLCCVKKHICTAQ
jgi:putative two-component system response regulator